MYTNDTTVFNNEILRLVEHWGSEHDSFMNANSEGIEKVRYFQIQ